MPYSSASLVGKWCKRPPLLTCAACATALSVRWAAPCSTTIVMAAWISLARVASGVFLVIAASNSPYGRFEQYTVHMDGCQISSLCPNSWAVCIDGQAGHQNWFGHWV